MNFIQESTIKNLLVCDQLIDYFKNSKNTKHGMVNSGINKNMKESVDLTIDAIEDLVVVEYINELKNEVNKYIDNYPICNKYSKFGILETFNIQHYKPGQGFYEWHCERTNAHKPFCDRHLVWMTYLNDVTDGGETEFFHQQLKVKPKKGKTLIFPADWTHTHRGITSYTQDKYIITGWFNYI